MNYDTALRGYTSKRIEEIDSADILIGIPCYNNEKTIAHVILLSLAQPTLQATFFALEFKYRILHQLLQAWY